MDAVNKQAKYSLTILRLKASKYAVNEINRGQKDKSKVQIMFLEVNMHLGTYA